MFDRQQAKAGRCWRVAGRLFGCLHCLAIVTVLDPKMHPPTCIYLLAIVGVYVFRKHQQQQQQNESTILNFHPQLKAQIQFNRLPWWVTIIHIIKPNTWICWCCCCCSTLACSGCFGGFVFELLMSCEGAKGSNRIMS